MNTSIFKAYDIRGVYPDELNEEGAFEIGRMFANYIGGGTVIVGRDMRLSSPVLFKQFAKGITSSGLDVVNIGTVSTDALYFASGHWSLPAVMITASHNPKEYNGFKLCEAGAGAIQPEKLITNNQLLITKKKGRVIKKDILKDFREHILNFADVSQIKPLKIAVDAGNGMAGKMIKNIFKNLPVKIIPLYFKLDGSFPNHEANPMKPENIEDLRQLVLKKKADLGVVFDGDADRIFFIDETGRRIAPSLIGALLSKKLLIQNSGQKIVYSLLCGQIVRETIEKYGGEAVMERAGHVFIKQRMRETGAIFGIEHSAHYYFERNFFAESGFAVLLMVLEIISRENKPFSEILKEFDKYFAFEEMNFKMDDDKKKSVLKLLGEKYSNGRIDQTDGLTVKYNDWWFNLRPSNTEPVMRLNLEAINQGLAEEKKNEILKIISQE